MTRWSKEIDRSRNEENQEKCEETFKEKPNGGIGKKHYRRRKMGQREETEGFASSLQRS
jgi:hypothetical protein